MIRRITSALIGSNPLSSHTAWSLYILFRDMDFVSPTLLLLCHISLFVRQISIFLLLSLTTMFLLIHLLFPSSFLLLFTIHPPSCILPLLPYHSPSPPLFFSRPVPPSLLFHALTCLLSLILPLSASLYFPIYSLSFPLSPLSISLSPLSCILLKILLLDHFSSTSFSPPPSHYFPTLHIFPVVHS